MQTCLMGATQLVVATGISNIMCVNLGRHVNGCLLKIATGSGTLSIVNAGMTAPQGYPVGANEVVAISGPAIFYLAASGATTTAALAISYSAGYSLYP